MAEVVHLACDLCGSQKDVGKVLITAVTKYELDMCAKCYKTRLGELEKIGRKPRGRRRGYTITEDFTERP